MILKILNATVIKLFSQAFGSQLRCNMTAGVISMGINVVALAVSYPLYLHLLGYEKYGLWLILSMVLGFARLGLLGVRSAVIKLVSEEYAIENIEGIQSYIMMALAIVTCMGIFALSIILIFRAQIIVAFKLSGENAELVSWLLPYIGLLSIYVLVVQVLNATLSGFGRMDLGSYIDAGGRITAISMSVFLLYLGFGVKGLLIGNAFSYVVVHFTNLFFIHRKAQMHLFRASNWDRQKFKRLLSFGGGIFGSSLFGLLLDPFNKLMLSRYAGVAAIPVYEICFRGAMYLRSLIEAGLRAIMPEISRVGVKMTIQSKTIAFAINKRLMKLILIYVIPMYLAVFVFAEIVLRIWLRDKYVELLPVYFRVMLIASFVSLLGIPAYYTLMGQGRVRCCFGSHAVLSVINVAVVLLHVIISPSIVESRVYYAVLLGCFGSTIFLFWQFWLHNKKDSN